MHCNCTLVLYNCIMSYERVYPLPKKSFFLFGPRGVGKSTWVRQNFKSALFIDLLNHQTFLQLQTNPQDLESKIAHLKKGSFVVLDEIQKVPALLDEVHRLMEAKSLQFILTGSSARKIKRSGANLLAGRALTHKMYPFSILELGKKNIRNLMTYGTLPVVINAIDQAEDTLYSYVQTYLVEEIRQEALVRRLDSFNRFLQIAARLNTQVINFTNIGRETGHSTSLIIEWYSILEDTLLGARLEPYRPNFKVRESGHPKFYWFDPGVARVAAQIAATDFGSTEMGASLETLVFNELHIYQECSRKMRPIYYYATPSSGEIDFVIELKPKTIDRPVEFITLEVKSATKWHRKFEEASRSLKSFAQNSHKRMFGIYLGNERLTHDGFEVFPLHDFLKALHAGEIF